MTRRISKRAMLHRLDDLPLSRIHLDDLRSRSAKVMVEGVLCEVDFPRKARDELLSESGIFGYVASIPYAIGDGSMTPGSKAGEYSHSMTRSPSRWPKVMVFDAVTETADQAFLCFQQQHPIGSVISGKVRLVNRRVAILDLGLGLQGRLDKGECLDHTPGIPVKWLSLPSVGDCVDVMVRGYIANSRIVTVSLHSFHLDTDFCAHSAGFRRSFDATNACFRKLPWENQTC